LAGNIRFCPTIARLPGPLRGCRCCTGAAQGANGGAAAQSVLAITFFRFVACYFVAMKFSTGSLLCALAVSAGPLVAAAQAQPPVTYVGGEVMFVSGRADRVRQDGAAGPVAKGMQLLEGDRIRTQQDSHVYVRLRDGGLLVVRPASELYVDLWRFDAAQPQDSQIKYTLDNGVARHVSGKAAKAAREKFRFNTPMAAIGVRGTDFTVLADPGVTRVSVQSGGVVVNSFGDGCRADGLGPCEGASAVELFASAKDKLLQLRRGERRPEVIDDTSASPDKSRPPAGGEPTARQPGASDVDVAESRGSELVAGQVLPEKTVPPPPEPPPPIAAWGRWVAIAANDTGVVSAQEVLNGRSLVAINRFYVLAANKPETALELPGAGVGNFALTAHDGVIFDKTTGKGVASTASDGRLSIDFGSRRFETSMTVKGGDLSTQISGKGAVESNGKFTSDAFATPSTIQGLVGGKDASEAMYLYQRSINGRYDASGATSWRK
jgi:hypothetical protein